MDRIPKSGKLVVFSTSSDASDPPILDIEVKRVAPLGDKWLTYVTKEDPNTFQALNTDYIHSWKFTPDPD